MRFNFLRGFLGITFSVLALFCLPSARAQGEIRSYTINKTVLTIQTNPTTAKLLRPAPYLFNANVELHTNTGYAATIRIPQNQMRNLVLRGNEFDYSKPIKSRGGLDILFPSGRYQFRVLTTNALYEADLFHTGNAYPSVPLILNWADAQAVEHSMPMKIQWSPFVGGTTNDLILFEVYNSQVNSLIFSALEQFPQGLTGQATEITIPANKLQPGANHVVVLGFTRPTVVLVHADGAIGQSIFSRVHSFNLSTLPQVNSNSIGRFQFQSARYTVSEGAGEAVISVTRANPNGAASVAFKAGGVTAVSGQDFVPTNGVLQFANGVTSNSFTIQIKEDFHREGNELIKLALSGVATNGELGPRKIANLIVVDNEVPGTGTLQFNSAVITVPERSTSARVVVSRVGGATGTVSVRYEIVPGTATAGEDYDTTAGILQFAPGQLSQAITIPLHDDTIDEANETFVLRLSEVVGGAALGLARTTISITDDDAAGIISFANNSFTVDEDDTNVTISVIRTKGLASNVTVDYNTVPMLATEQDFTMANGTLVFGVGETNKVFQVPITADFMSEGSEFFIIRLSNPTGRAKLGAIPSGTVTIEDRDR